jgi:hypothetical protein
MTVRRVVTGHTPDGKSTVASDAEVDAITLGLLPGTQFWRLWGADEAPTFPDDGSPRSAQAYFPSVGGFLFGVFTIGPDSVSMPKDLDMQLAMVEIEDKLPGVAARLEADNPGMHTTDTIDFEYVLSGEVWLELDGGRAVHIRAGDTVVQNGTRHAWRNKGTERCRVVFFLVGAHRR